MKRVGLAVALAVFANGCDDNQGPRGPKGDPGDPGSAGTQGAAGAQGATGAQGAAGTSCYDGLDDQNGDGVVDVLDCRGKDGLSGLNEPYKLTDAEVAAIEGRSGVAECLTCHKTANPNMVKDFVFSGMAIKGNVACVDCHADNDAIASGEGHRNLPSPSTCKTCHPNEYAGHRANRHSIGSIRNYECGRFDDFPRVFANGSGYHFNDQDVAQLQALMNSSGNGPGADYNVTAIAKCMQCHNVENRCDSCHTRHRFSPAEARHPEACGTCHMGPDHPQIEMYETSKHGVMFASEGNTHRVPVCVDCHMPYNGKIFPKKTDDQSGAEYVSHDLSLTSAYGPVGGGTTRSGFVSENDRVKFVSKEPAGVAAYDELWYSWEDGKVYTTATGTTVAYDDIYTMSIQDENDNGNHDYKVQQVPDLPEKLAAARTLMLQVCTKCHAENFADERLLVADLIHENTKMTELEAYDIVTALAAADIGPYSTMGDRPTNPDRGNNDLAANMKIRNLTSLERQYFHIMKYDQVKTWKGAYHFNPDFTHWYGWVAVNMKLGDIGDMATQQVLLDLWVRGVPYPGASANIFEDGLYQGTMFVNGIDETNVQVENFYDKFPGPNDGYLDWYHQANGTHDPAGDGTPDNEQPIDIDMDGTPELVKTDGAGNPLGPGTYRAVATDKIITFH